MKICWDNLEKLRYSKKTGKWYKGTQTFVYKDKCKECKDSFIGSNYSIYCSGECSNKGENHPLYNKKHSNEAKEKMSKNRTKEKNGFYGKKHSNEAKEKNRRKHFKNGIYSVKEKNIPLYDTYAHQISYTEEVRRNKEDSNILEVKCTYCGKWYIPKQTNVLSRIRALNGKIEGESRLYCSDSCKQDCPVYLKSKYPKGYKKATSREVQPELRQMVFERDEYMCQKCFSTKSLHCHHIEGVEINPIESADIDICITYCKSCHEEVHLQEGCKRSDYKRKKCKEIL